MAKINLHHGVKTRAERKRQFAGDCPVSDRWRACFAVSSYSF